MRLSVFILFRLFNVLLLIPGQKCLNGSNHFITAPYNKLPINLYTTASIPRYSSRIHPLSSIESQMRIDHAKHRSNYHPFRNGRTIMPSVPRSLNPITTLLQPTTLLLRWRRGLNRDSFNSFSSDLRLQSSAPSSDPRISQPQVTQFPLSEVSENRLTSTYNIPTPTPKAITNPTNDPSKSRLPVVSSTIASSAKSPASKSPLSAEHTSNVNTSQDSGASLNNHDSSLTGLQKVGSYFKSSNRLAPLAYILTIGSAFGALVTFVSFLKCVCHQRRFANHKDYPEGFPWVAPNQDYNGEIRKKGLLSRHASHISARNSIVTSEHFSRGQLGAASRVNSSHVEYQLNDLRSLSDVDVHYLNSLRENSENDLEKDLSNASDKLPSSSSTEESSQLTPLSLLLDLKLENDKWDMRSANGSHLLFHGGASEQEHINEDITKTADK